jgi:hypothetical protein
MLPRFAWIQTAEAPRLLLIRHWELLFFQALLNEGVEQDFDPFADRRRPTIADREDEYRQKRRKLMISPERVDPFAEGTFLFSTSSS